MARLDVRCNSQLPVTLLSTDMAVPLYTAETRDVSLGGAFVTAAVPLPEDAAVRLVASLPNSSSFEAKGRILRKEANGVALSFVDMDPSAKSALWRHIADSLTEEEACPYCRHVNPASAEQCALCGLSMDFSSQRYIEMHEREVKDRWLELIEAATSTLLEDLDVIAARAEQGKAEAPEIAEVIEQTVRSFTIKAEKFENAVEDPALVKKAQVRFRQRTDHVLSKGYFVKRTRIWPQGYQGDYKTLESLYRNTPLSTGFGYYLDLAFLEAPLSVGVKNRIVELEKMLQHELYFRQGPSMLNIACGSCRELMGLAPDIVKADAKVTCIDTDNDALAFAENRLAYTGALSHFTFRKYNALRLFDDELNLSEFGKQDIIYSVGLFDYIDTDFLIKMLGALYRLLKPAGRLIAAFKDVDRYAPQLYHWIVDWDGFKQRGAAEFESILAQAGIPATSILEQRDSSGVIVFYLITKQ